MTAAGCPTVAELCKRPTKASGDCRPGCASFPTPHRQLPFESGTGGLVHAGGCTTACYCYCWCRVCCCVPALPHPCPFQRMAQVSGPCGLVLSLITKDPSSKHPLKIRALLEHQDVHKGEKSAEKRDGIQSLQRGWILSHSISTINILINQRWWVFSRGSRLALLALFRSFSTPILSLAGRPILPACRLTFSK